MKALEKEIALLKQELAIHDSLVRNRLQRLRWDLVKALSYFFFCSRIS